MGKYILQYGSLAGWPFRVAEGLRRAGHASINVVQEDADFADLSRKLPHHRALVSSQDSRARKLLALTGFVREAAIDCSLIHYHGGTILPGRWHHLFEGKVLARRGVPMLMSFGGSDGRVVSEARSKNPYFHLDLDERRDQRTRRYLRAISRHIRYAATDCEMISYVEPYFERCYLFRQPVDLRAIGFVEPANDRPPVILHVPTDLAVKGTDRVLAAVERLRSEGLIFEFRLKRRLSQAEMYEEISTCDIYVDELRCGSHGVTSVETMAAGKPTLTYIRPDLVARYPTDLPLVNTNPDTIYDRLKELICDPGMRRELGFQGRRYVEKYHDADVVARDLLAIYRDIGLT